MDSYVRSNAADDERGYRDAGQDASEETAGPFDAELARGALRFAAA
jgi:hypothetical protein